MSERDHGSWREELSPYLLGALDPGREAELERHLETCEDCHRELTWLRPAAQLLPESVERVEPPPALRARIMAEVAEQAEAPGRSRRRLPIWLRQPRLAAGLTLLLVCAVAAIGYAISSGDGGGGSTTIVAGEPPGVTARMVSEGDSGTLRLANVEQLPPRRVLQLWVQRDERVESAALLVPDRDGTATAVLDDMDGVEVVMVTTEPRGGSESPTSAPLISVEASQ